MIEFTKLLLVFRFIFVSSSSKREVSLFFYGYASVRNSYYLERQKERQRDTERKIVSFLILILKFFFSRKRKSSREREKHC